MARRFVDDGGNNTTGLAWDTAYTSINALISAEASFLATAGNEVVFGADMQCQAVNTGTLTITGATSGAPVIFTSSTVYPGTSTVSYAKGTGNQIDTSEGAYSITFDGAFALFGLKMKSGANIQLPGDNTERASVTDCTLLPGNSGYVYCAPEGSSRTQIKDLTVDNIGDTGSTTNNIIRASSSIWYGGFLEIDGLTLLNYSNRSRHVIDFEGGAGRVSNVDFSALSSTPYPFNMSGVVEISNCKMYSNTQWKDYNSAEQEGSGEQLWTNCGTSDRPWWLGHRSTAGSSGTNMAVCFTEADNTVYRTGGASVSGTPVSWKCTPTAVFGAPYKGPWMYGKFASTGSHTVSVYIAQDGGSGDLTDEKVWLELQYQATAGSPIWTTITDAKADYFATAAAQADDSGGESDWNGMTTASYAQILSVTPTVGVAGQFRCRVVAASTEEFYYDPKPVVT